MAKKPGIGQIQRAIKRSVPAARTIYEFMTEYRGEDKVRRLLNSFAVGYLETGCSGAMISPHVFLTAAHCGGPGWTSFVRLFHIDEDAETPGTSTQAFSQQYRATAFPWQSWESPTAGGGDTNLWWVEDGADGVAPGIKYGYLELSGERLEKGDDVYSFWVNEISRFRGQALGNTLLHSTGTTGDTFTNWYGPAVNYDLYSAGGASGSPIIGLGKHDHRVVGVSSGGEEDARGRNASRTRDFRNRFDADRNRVLDAIEYDWLFTRAPCNFCLLEFETPLERLSQWKRVLRRQTVVAA